MADSFDFTFTNPNAATASLELLSAVTANSQKSTKFRAVTPYVASYDAGTTIIFRTTVNENAYTISAPATPTEILAYFNTLNVGTFTLFASNAIDGNIFDVISPYPYTELEINGTVITFFNIGTGFDTIVYATAIQPDGKIIVGGAFTDFNGTSVNRIVRLNTDGTIDTSFITGTGFNSNPFDIVIQPDNKILIGGAFTDYNSNPVNYIVRLNSDGSIDTGFNIGTGFDNFVYSIALQGTKILCGGGFTQYNGNLYINLIRLNSDGTFDSTWLGGDLNGIAETISLQIDNKILVGGNFSNYIATSTNNIIRLNSDGTIDTSFIYGTGFDLTVFNIIPKTDTKILISGTFNTYNGNSANGIIQLNSDGSVDTSFNSGTGFDFSHEVHKLALQTDNKILAIGLFSSYNGATAWSIVRINTDGSIDNTFDSGNGFNGILYALKIQTDNKLIIGGDFSIYNVMGFYNNIVRLNNDGSSNTISS